MVESTIEPNEIQVRKIENGIAKLLCRWDITEEEHNQENMDIQLIYVYEETNISWILPDTFIDGAEVITIESMSTAERYLEINKEEIMTFARAKKNLNF